MRTSIKAALAVPMLVSISACGGGGVGTVAGSGTGFTGVDPRASGYLNNSNQFNLAPVTNPAFYPATATYSGYATLLRGPVYYGDVNVSVDFTNRNVNGSITNFGRGATLADVSLTNTSGNVTLTGTVTNSNSLVSPAITGVASGTIDGASSVMTMNGNFTGVNAEYMSLDFSGGGTSVGSGAYAVQN